MRKRTTIIVSVSMLGCQSRWVKTMVCRVSNSRDLGVFWSSVVIKKTKQYRVRLGLKPIWALVWFGSAVKERKQDI